MKKTVTVIISALILAIGFRLYMFTKMGRPPMPDPTVELTEVKEKTINDKIESVGRIVPKYSVDLQARVQGYLQKRYFEEGSFVKKGALLFLIEPDQYQNAVQQTNANIQNAQAALEESEKNLVRVSELVKKDFISKSMYDNALAARDMAKASLTARKANYKDARLSLGYTRIYAPVSGRIGSINITEGNVVGPMSAPLAKIVSVDPIYVTFNIKAKDFIKLQRELKQGEKRNVELRLPDDSIYEYKGVLDFYNNIVDETTATIKLRATFKNPDQLLIPGQYATVVATSPNVRKVKVVAQEAIQESPEGKFVYVVDKDNKVKTKPVMIGEQIEGYYVLKQGLETGEKVIYKGIQKIRPDVKVTIAPETTQEEGEKKDVQ